MSEIKVLDCTLRDGGYCNQWRFGRRNIKKLVNALNEAGVDIIECGFLTSTVSYDEETTRFTDLSQLDKVIPHDKKGKAYVCMMNYGELDPETLLPCDETPVDGIRLAFHKRDLNDAFKVGRIIVEKGYKLFIQAMVSMTYSDHEFLELIEKSNELSPYAFYIVDSFGVMQQSDLMRFFYLVENNLHPDIQIGYHAHNNMQMAFANAQAFSVLPSKRHLIIDTSVYGMGRGAGNLNTELFVDYLNNRFAKSYQLKPLLKVIDEVLDGFYNTGKWGYSLPNYLSAAHNCHPSYANYLDDKKTLTIESMDAVFSMISEEKRSSYDKKYIESLYLKYMSRGEKFDGRMSEIRALLDRKTVLVIAPGRSAEMEKEKIMAYASSKDIATISVNFDYRYLDTNLIFISNLRRFEDIDQEKWKKSIVTTNIACENAYLQVDYTTLLNEEEAVRDNAGMMLLRFLILLGVKDIVIAGMDGYSYDSEDNYLEMGMQLVIRRAVLDEMNQGMGRMIETFSRQANIRFLTQPKYFKIQL